MMRRLSVCTAILLISTMAAAEEPVIPADEFVYCTVCHGVQLMGNEILGAPRISGMDAYYVERQLRSFKEGWRGTHAQDATGREMHPMASALTDGQIGEAAAFVEATRSEAPVSTVIGDKAAGEMFYGTCSACHGTAGEGNRELNGPPLAGRNDWYLVRQLQNFRDGVRGTHPQDVYGRQMAAAMMILSDNAAINDVVAYIVSLDL